MRRRRHGAAQMADAMVRVWFWLAARKHQEGSALHSPYAVGESSIAAVDVMGDDAEFGRRRIEAAPVGQRAADIFQPALPVGADRKSTRLNSSHLGISYAV